MNILRRTIAATSLIAVTLLTAGCYELHITANVDQTGHVTGGSLEMAMTKSSFDALSSMGGMAGPGGLKGFEQLVNQSSEGDGSPAAGRYASGCKYSEKSIDSTDYYSAVCEFDAKSMEKDVTIDQVLGLTAGKTVVSDGTLSISGAMPDTSNGDPSSMEMATSMGLKIDTTLHFANKVVSVDGNGVEIDSTDPNTVLVNNLKATGTDIAIVVEVPSNNMTIYIAGGVAVVVLGGIGWFLFTRSRKNKKN